MQVSAQECQACAGTGWKPVEAPQGERTPSRGRVTRCECRIGARNERLLARARVPRRYEHCSLESYHTEFDQSGSLERARISAFRFVEEYPVENTGLLLIGPIGVGKTHLAVGILRELVLQKGVPCLFYDYRELLKEIQNSYNPSVQATELSILRPVFDAEVLVLDELGAVKPSEWVWDTVSHILNTRYNDRRTTIITTNFEDGPPASAGEDLPPARRAARSETLGDRIGERMRSRLHEMCRILRLQGGDFRHRVQSANFR